MKSEEINSLADYIKQINIIIKEKSNEDNIFWFRGEGKKDRKTILIPGSYRVLVNESLSDINKLVTSPSIRDIEDNTSADFYRKSITYLADKNIVNNPCTRYFIMQHYGINTRLLAWSENAIIALFFAISNTDEINEDAGVWILNPIKLNEYTINNLSQNKSLYKSFIPTSLSYKPKTDLWDKSGILIADELTRRYLKADFGQHEEGREYYPLAIYPPRLDKRMTAQKACFTIFGNKVNGLSPNEGADYIDSVTIKAAFKMKILSELKNIGFDFESIYPDLDGLGKAIKSKYSLLYKNDVQITLNNLGVINTGTENN